MLRGAIPCSYLGGFGRGMDLLALIACTFSSTLGCAALCCIVRWLLGPCSWVCECASPIVVIFLPPLVVWRCVAFKLICVVVDRQVLWQRRGFACSPGSQPISRKSFNQQYVRVENLVLIPIAPLWVFIHPCKWSGVIVG